MNRFIIIDGLPYLFANNSVHSVRWDKDGFTVGEKVDKAFSPYPLLTEKEVHAKCAVLDSIGAETKESNNLDDMTLAELKEYAEVNGIDLNGARAKATILKAIKSAEGVLQHDNDGN